MATLRRQIAEKFLVSLADVEGWDPKRLDKLRELLAAEKVPKAEDFVCVFSMAPGGEIE